MIHFGSANNGECTTTNIFEYLLCVRQCTASVTQMWMKLEGKKTVGETLNQKESWQQNQGFMNVRLKSLDLLYR